MLKPEFLSTLETDVHLVADLIALRAAIPGKTLETARQMVRKVVDDLMRLARSCTSISLARWPVPPCILAQDNAYTGLLKDKKRTLFGKKRPNRQCSPEGDDHELKAYILFLV
jgi:hypothetical protein